jgi:hypothetical protein
MFRIRLRARQRSTPVVQFFLNVNFAMFDGGVTVTINPRKNG